MANRIRRPIWFGSHTTKKWTFTKWKYIAHSSIIKQPSRNKMKPKKICMRLANKLEMVACHSCYIGSYSKVSERWKSIVLVWIKWKCLRKIRKIRPNLDYRAKLPERLKFIQLKMHITLWIECWRVGIVRIMPIGRSISCQRMKKEELSCKFMQNCLLNESHNKAYARPPTINFQNAAHTMWKMKMKNDKKNRKKILKHINSIWNSSHIKYA